MADFALVIDLDNVAPPDLVTADEGDSVILSATSVVATPPTVETWVNRAWDTSIGANVIWETTGGPDITDGTSYPGPGTFDPTEGGNDTESHVVQTVR